MTKAPGLETVAKVDSNLGDMSRLSIIDRPLPIGTEVCLRSQVEKLLAEKDETIDRHREAQVILGKQLNEVVDRMSDDYLALKAELDQAVGVIEDRSSEYKALEAKLAAAEKALKAVDSLRSPFQPSDEEIASAWALVDAVLEPKP